MKYLLSNGRSTEDKVTYIKDLILINMLLIPDEIPYYKGGSEELIQDVLEYNLESHITSIINKIINRVTSLVKGISVSLSEVKVLDSSIKVLININGLINTYEIKRFN